jgi:hypothetical protein
VFSRIRDCARKTRLSSRFPQTILILFSAAARRKKVAHSVSCGFTNETGQSPAGATENTAQKKLSPLPGLLH